MFFFAKIQNGRPEAIQKLQHTKKLTYIPL